MGFLDGDSYAAILKGFERIHPRLDVRYSSYWDAHTHTPIGKTSSTIVTFLMNMNRWERFEELLEEARNTRDYDVTLAINQMVDYLLSENGAQIREQLSVQLVDQVDQLGVDAITFARKNVGQVRRMTLLLTHDLLLQS